MVTSANTPSRTRGFIRNKLFESSTWDASIRLNDSATPRSLRRRLVQAYTGIDPFSQSFAMVTIAVTFVLMMAAVLPHGFHRLTEGI